MADLDMNDVVDNESMNDQNAAHRIDTKALNGLRGLLSLWILIHHSIVFSKLEINLLVSVQMPFFFLISGFILALNYGKGTYEQTKCCSSNPNHFNSKNFYQKRIARTIPIYYLTNIICIPLVYGGFYWIEPGEISEYLSYIFTLFVASTWAMIPSLTHIHAVNDTSWFVSTMWFFYWVFPILLPKLQKYTTEQKQKWIKYHFLLQFVIGTVLFVTLYFIPATNSFDAFYFATFWPISRLPIFIMGILCGLLRNVGEEGGRYFNSMSADKLSLGFILFFFVGPIIETLSGGLSALILWGQLLFPLLQLKLIYSLTCQISTSLTYKILTNKYMLYLGRISYCLYLIHPPLIYYICWIEYGTITKPDCDDRNDNECSNEWETWMDHRLMPIWCIPIIWIVSFGLAEFLTNFVEEPMRKLLNPKHASSSYH